MQWKMQVVILLAATITLSVAAPRRVHTGVSPGPKTTPSPTTAEAADEESEVTVDDRETHADEETKAADDLDTVAGDKDEAEPVAVAQPEPEADAVSAEPAQEEDDETVVEEVKTTSSRPEVRVKATKVKQNAVPKMVAEKDDHEMVETEKTGESEPKGAVLAQMRAVEEKEEKQDPEAVTSSAEADEAVRDGKSVPEDMKAILGLLKSLCQKVAAFVGQPVSGEQQGLSKQ